MPNIKAIARAPRLLQPMISCDEVEITVDKGITGDARGAKRGRQITLLFEDDWKDACAEVDASLPWTDRRANFLVTGMRSPRETGGLITIGEVVLEIIQETNPCELMESTKTGLKAALTPSWRGGVCCNVKNPGRVKIGDEVVIT